MPESRIRKILNQIKWDSNKTLADYEITFLHRGAPEDLKTYPAEKIQEIESSYLLFIDEETDEDIVIPFHRIRKIYNKKTKEIVWEKAEE
jgi:uncharacterized protein (UPF0248 family)